MSHHSVINSRYQKFLVYILIYDINKYQFSYRKHDNFGHSCENKTTRLLTLPKPPLNPLALISEDVKL